MLIRNMLTLLTSLVLAVVFLLGTNNWLVADQRVDVTGGGTGIYCPATGYFFGPGDGTPLGKSYLRGSIALEPTNDPLTFSVQKHRTWDAG